MKRSLMVKNLVLCGVIAAMYTALTVLLEPISYGGTQFRISEALTLLPMLFPQTVPALAVGCFLANLLGGCTLLDIIFGSLATLLAAYLTSKHTNPFLGAVYPVVINAIVIGAVLTVTTAEPSWALLGLNMAGVGIGQLGACYLVGVPLVYVLRRVPVIRTLGGRDAHGRALPQKEIHE